MPAQGFLGTPLLEHDRRLIGGDAKKESLILAGKVRLLRASDQNPTVALIPDGNDGKAHLAITHGVDDDRGRIRYTEVK